MKNRFIVALTAAALTCAGLIVATAPAAQAAPASYPTRSGTILVTTDPWVAKWGIVFFQGFGHSAIVYNTSQVVESISSGVTLGANDWYTARKKVTGVTVSSTTTAQDSQAASWAYSQIGKPYNINYYDMGTRSKFYCSQLVWAAFKDKYGIDLNTSQWDINLLFIHETAIAPTELVSTPKTSTIYTQG